MFLSFLNRPFRQSPCAFAVSCGAFVRVHTFWFHAGVFGNGLFCVFVYFFIPFFLSGGDCFNAFLFLMSFLNLGTVFFNLFMDCL
jgi:hypothetical protein